MEVLWPMDNTSFPGAVISWDAVNCSHRVRACDRISPSAPWAPPSCTFPPRAPLHPQICYDDGDVETLCLWRETVIPLKPLAPGELPPGSAKMAERAAAAAAAPTGPAPAAGPKPPRGARSLFPSPGAAPAADFAPVAPAPAPSFAPAFAPVSPPAFVAGAGRGRGRGPAPGRTGGRFRGSGRGAAALAASPVNIYAKPRPIIKSRQLHFPETQAAAATDADPNSLPARHGTRGAMKAGAFRAGMMGSLQAQEGSAAAADPVAPTVFVGAGETGAAAAAAAQPLEAVEHPGASAGVGLAIQAKRAAVSDGLVAGVQSQPTAKKQKRVPAAGGVMAAAEIAAAPAIVEEGGANAQP